MIAKDLWCSIGKCRTLHCGACGLLNELSFRAVAARLTRAYATAVPQSIESRLYGRSGLRSHRRGGDDALLPGEVHSPQNIADSFPQHSLGTL